MAEDKQPKPIVTFSLSAILKRIQDEKEREKQAAAEERLRKMEEEMNGKKEE